MAQYRLDVVGNNPATYLRYRCGPRCCASTGTPFGHTVGGLMRFKLVSYCANAEHKSLFHGAIAVLEEGGKHLFVYIEAVAA